MIPDALAPTPTPPLSAARRWIDVLDTLGSGLSGLVLRLFVAWEFWESGLEKVRGTNWFEDISDRFPFPLSAVPVEVSWHLATWTELAGPVFLVLGLGTRFWAAALMVLTIVAWMAVHAGNGYNVCDNGWKLPLIYLVACVPLVLQGAGRLSVDRWLRGRSGLR